MKKTFVLRTEAILSSVDATMRFGDDNTIVIPMAILQELYTYEGIPERQQLASQLIERLSEIPQEELLSKRGYQQENGSFLRVVDNSGNLDEMQGVGDFSHLDKRVFQVCLDLQKNGKRNVILISKNPAIRFKAHQLGIEAQPFKDELFPTLKDQYKGYVEVWTSAATLSKLYKEGKFSVEEIYQYKKFDWEENEFVNIQTESSSGIGRYTGGNIVALEYTKRLPRGCKSLNLEQTMFWEALLAPPEEVPLVVVKGAAGTGKTYCSIAMALDKLRGYSQNEIYDQILVATPTVTVSDEKLGYLPGDIDAKVGPYMGGIMDNLKAIFRQESPEDDNATLKDKAQELFDRGFIEIQPIGFLRGRTIPHTVFIIDETQNIKPEIIKDIVSRAAEGSKFIFLGDPEQVNTKGLNSRYNGLVYLSEKMKGNSVCWQVTLNKEKSVRGILSQIAIEVL